MEWIIITLLMGAVGGLYFWVWQLQKDVEALQRKTRYTL